MTELELLRLQYIGDDTYATARERFGEPGIIDMVGVAGYYSLLSMMMNTARMAAPHHISAGSECLSGWTRSLGNGLCVWWAYHWGGDGSPGVVVAAV